MALLQEGYGAQYEIEFMLFVQIRWMSRLNLFVFGTFEKEEIGEL